MTLRMSEFVPVHTGAIRDVLFSTRGDGLVLTVGVDKTLKLTSMHSNTVVQKYVKYVRVYVCACKCMCVCVFVSLSFAVIN